MSCILTFSPFFATQRFQWQTDGPVTPVGSKLWRSDQVVEGKRFIGTTILDPSSRSQKVAFLDCRQLALQSWRSRGRKQPSTVVFHKTIAARVAAAITAGAPVFGGGSPPAPERPDPPPEGSITEFPVPPTIGDAPIRPDLSPPDFPPIGDGGPPTPPPGPTVLTGCWTLAEPYIDPTERARKYRAEIALEDVIECPFGTWSPILASGLRGQVTVPAAEFITFDFGDPGGVLGNYLNESWNIRSVPDYAGLNFLFTDAASPCLSACGQLLLSPDHIESVAYLNSILQSFSFFLGDPPADSWTSPGHTTCIDDAAPYLCGNCQQVVGVGESQVGGASGCAFLEFRSGIPNTQPPFNTRCEVRMIYPTAIINQTMNVPPGADNRCSVQWLSGSRIFLSESEILAGPTPMAGVGLGESRWRYFTDVGNNAGCSLQVNKSFSNPSPLLFDMVTP